jgi:hypothetical protein
MFYKKPEKQKKVNYFKHPATITSGLKPYRSTKAQFTDYQEGMAILYYIAFM